MVGASNLRDIDWNLLRMFHEIARAGGVSEAARKLGRKQPAVSLALKRLEDLLGVRLCERGPAGFRLSDEGEFVAEVAWRMVQQVEEIPGRIAHLSELVSGTLRIMVISNIVDEKLNDAIRAFHARYPAVEVQIEVGTWDVIIRAVLRNRVDIGVAPARHIHAQLRYDLLCKEIHRPYCGRDYALFGTTCAGPEELVDAAFILTGEDEPDDLTDYRLRHGLGTHCVGISDHLEEARRLALLGMGVCFLPEKFAQRDVERERLWPLLPPGSEPSMDVFLVTNPKTLPKLPRQLFMEEFRKQPDPTPA